LKSVVDSHLIYNIHPYLKKKLVTVKVCPIFLIMAGVL